VHLRHSLHSVESVELVVAPIEGLREIAIAGEVFLLDLEVGWPAAAVVHVVGAVDRGPHVHAVLWVLRVAIGHVELRLLLIAGVLGVGIDAFAFESLPDDLALDELLSPFEVAECTHDFGVCWHDVLLEVDLLGTQVVLHPRRAVLLVGGVVQTALGGLGKGSFSRHFYL
jgi:hypothetical protein